MNWKRVSIEELTDGTIVRLANNVTMSGFGNLIDTHGVYKTFDGVSVASIMKGSLGVVFEKKIEIMNSPYLKEVLEKIEKSVNPFKFSQMEVMNLLHFKTHTLKIDHHILKDFEALV